jgi:hypothetical protein
VKKKPNPRHFCCFLSLVVIEAILAPPAEENAQHGSHDDEEGDPFGYDPCNIAGVKRRASVEVRCVCGRRSERCRCGGKWRCNEMRCFGGLFLLVVPFWLLHIVELVEFGSACGKGQCEWGRCAGDDLQL